SLGPPACATDTRIVGPHAGATAFGGATGAAIPNVAPPRSGIGRPAAAIAKWSCRNRGARRLVATGPALCLGRDRPQPVRLLGVGPVGLRAGRDSPGPHYISADPRWDPGTPFASPAGRPRLP